MYKPYALGVICRVFQFLKERPRFRTGASHTRTSSVFHLDNPAQSTDKASKARKYIRSGVYMILQGNGSNGSSSEPVKAPKAGAKCTRDGHQTKIQHGLSADFLS